EHVVEHGGDLGVGEVGVGRHGAVVRDAVDGDPPHEAVEDDVDEVVAARLVQVGGVSGQRREHARQSPPARLVARRAAHVDRGAVDLLGVRGALASHRGGPRAATVSDDAGVRDAAGDDELHGAVYVDPGGAVGEDLVALEAGAGGRATGAVLLAPTG